MTSRDIGEFIRELRNNARISLRQLAEQTGVSNPYLSQIERGLRKPSAEVLQQIASALRVSTPMMYLRAGLLAERDGQGVLAAIAADPDLTDRHKKTLIDIYETFRRENARTQAAEPAVPAGGPENIGGGMDRPADVAAPESGETRRGTGADATLGRSTNPDVRAAATPAALERAGQVPAEPPAGTGSTSDPTQTTRTTLDKEM